MELELENNPFKALILTWPAAYDAYISLKDNYGDSIFEELLHFFNCPIGETK